MTTNRKSRYLAAELADRLILAALLAGIGMFIIYPICSVVVTSFFKDGHFTLEYYQALFTAKSIKLIKNSLKVAVLSSVLTTGFAFFLSLAVFAAKGKRKQFIRNSLVFTMISPPFVSSLAYIMLFGRRGSKADLGLQRSGSDHNGNAVERDPSDGTPRHFIGIIYAVYDESGRFRNTGGHRRKL